jgi:hypothetical protein
VGRFSRRTFLKGAGAALTVAGLDPVLSGLGEADAAVSAPVSMAMHIHASFSEGTGSMEAQLTEAKTNGIDVLWWTEHDWRMVAYGYRQAVHFDALTENENGAPLTWKQQTVGTLKQAAGTIVNSPASPLDTHPPASLQVTAKSTSSSFAFNRYLADDSLARNNLAACLGGQTISIEVYPTKIGSDSFLEILVGTSFRPPKGTRPAGQYLLSYRIGGPGTPGSRVASGLTGIITLPANLKKWNSYVLHPADDLKAIWPDVDGRDSSLTSFCVGAASRSTAVATGYFDYLRFTRTAPSDPMGLQAQLIAAYTPAFPAAQLAAMEISLYPQHINQYGGTRFLPDYSGLPLSPTASDVATQQLVGAIHSHGGLASMSHPFGTEGAPAGALPDADQEAQRRALASKLIGDNALGVDLFEAGYRLRGGVTIERHISVWDACSRNGIFLTGTGVSDNHNAQSWLTQANNFVTSAWAADKTAANLVPALGAGRCFFSDIGRFRGTLDLVADGTCPMGSASVSSLNSRTVQVSATGVPAGGTVRVVQGLVDYAGSGSPDPVTSVTTLQAADVAGGLVSVALDTTSSSFVRLEVADAAGVLASGSNPLWLLRGTPPNGIPAARQA